MGNQFKEIIFRLSYLTIKWFYTVTQTGMNYAAKATDSKCALLFATKIFELLKDVSFLPALFILTYSVEAITPPFTYT
jgi:hypothetical protein